VLGHHDDSSAVIFYIYPVPYVFSVTVHRQLPVVVGIYHYQGDELFRKLVWPVIVGTPGNYGIEAIGLDIRPYQQVGCGLGCRVGTVRGQRQILMKPAFAPEASVHFIRRDMEKPFHRILYRCVEENLYAQNIRPDKYACIFNAPVYMRFRCQIHDHGKCVLLKHLLDGYGVCYVGTNKRISPGIVLL